MAEESMRDATRTAVGNGRLPANVVRDIREGWRRQAALEQPVQKATPEMLGALGLGYRVEERPTKNG